LELPTRFQKSQVLLMAGHRRRRQQAGGTVTEMGLADRPKRFFIAVHEIRAGPSVDMKVHEPRHKVAISQVNDDLWRFSRRSKTRLDGLNVVAENPNASIPQQAAFKNDGASGEDHFERLSLLNPIQMVFRSNEKGPVANGIRCQGAFAQ
jgi:hypothetical protein